MSLVLGFKSLVFALDSESLALDYQSLALGSKSLVLPWAVSPWPWPRAVSQLTSDYQSLALVLEVVLDIGLEHSNFLETNPAPSSILTSVKKYRYLDFITEQSCSAGSVDSWNAVQQEADFQVGYSIICWKISSAAQPPRHRLTWG